VFRFLRLAALFDREAGATSLVGYTCDRCRVAYDPTVPLAEQANYMASLRGRAVPANFVRLRELSASVTLPTPMTRALRLRSGSMSISTSNLALWTSYPGADPESRSFNRNGLYSTPTLGVPQSRTWNVRFDAGF
jgi:hypothetical protein